MAIPEKPLEVSIDPDALTLDEMCLFDPEGFSWKGLKAFLADHTNWSAAEVGKLTLTELQAVTEQMKEAIQQAAVPLGKSKG